MLLVIDVGNTNLTLGLFQKDRLRKEFRVETKGFNKLPKLPWGKIQKVLIASVVPAVDKLLCREIKVPYEFVDVQNIPYIKVKFKNKKEIGADRLVNAVAAYKIYGGPAVIIDFGTATTFCTIRANGEYLGGVIAPGINLSRIVLHERTAKLPLISLYKPKKVIGDSTLTAMESGLVFGYGCMVDGMIQAIKKELKEKYKEKSPYVIATGGYAKLINEVLPKKIEHIDPQLTLKGLRIIAEAKR